MSTEQSEEGAQESQVSSSVAEESAGGRWAADQNQFVEEEVVADDGHVHYEEVYLDEDGNEVIEEVTGDSEAFNEEIIEEEEEADLAEMSDEFVIERSALEPQEDQVVVSEDSSVDDNVASEDASEDDNKASEADEQSSKDPSEPPYDPESDVENQRKILQKNPRGERSQMSYMLPLFSFAILVCFGLLLYFFVFADDDDNGGKVMPPATPAPTPIDYKLLEPTSTGAVDVASTTPLDPVQLGNCNFDQLDQPHVIDQCACFGEISVLAEDVRVRYEALVKEFIPQVFDGFDENRSSCSYRNQALVWLSTGVNNGGEAEFFVRKQRFALAIFFIEQGGLTWKDSTNWLSGREVCQWDHIACDENRIIRGIDLDRNDVTGQVSILCESEHFRNLFRADACFLPNSCQVPFPSWMVWKPSPCLKMMWWGRSLLRSLKPQLSNQ
jgi:hypothetical protein